MACLFRDPQTSSPAPALHEAESCIGGINTIPAAPSPWASQAMSSAVKLIRHAGRVVTCESRCRSGTSPDFINATHRHGTLSLLQESTQACTARIPWLRTPQELPICPAPYGAVTIDSPAPTHRKAPMNVCTCRTHTGRVQPGIHRSASSDVLLAICHWLCDAFAFATGQPQMDNDAFDLIAFTQPVSDAVAVTAHSYQTSGVLVVEIPVRSAILERTVCSGARQQVHRC